MEQTRDKVSIHAMLKPRLRESEPFEFESTAFDAVKHSDVIVAKDVGTARVTFVYGLQSFILPGLLRQLKREAYSRETQQDLVDKSNKDRGSDSTFTATKVLAGDFFKDHWQQRQFLFVELDADTSELQELLRLVTFVKGHHEYANEWID